MAVEFDKTELMKFRIRAELSTWVDDGEESVSAVDGFIYRRYIVRALDNYLQSSEPVEIEEVFLDTDDSF